MELAKYNEETIGRDRYSVIRYEDLTQNPEKEMIQLANFVGIPFSKSMLQTTILGLPWKEIIFWKKFFKAIKENVGRWENRMNDNEIN